MDRLEQGAIAPMPPEGPSTGESATRRLREIAPAADAIREVMAAKILHGWLQNRHQTLMPLQVNLGRLDEPSRERVASFAALAARAGGDQGGADRIRAWLGAAGADAPALAAFDRSWTDPPSLPGLMADLAAPELASLAYVVALVAAQEAGPASRAFADYVGARLGLPSAAIRSAERRYRA